MPKSTKSKSKDKKDVSKDKKDKYKDKKSKGKSEKSERSSIKSTAIAEKQISMAGIPNQGGMLPMVCVMHKSELKLYCETCEEVICELCITLGPHNNQLHRVTSIEKSYQNRIEKMDRIIKECLVQKRDQIEAQVYRLDYRMEEIKYVKSVIEQDAKTEFGGIIERLKNAEGKKLSVLQHMMSQIQLDVDEIQVLTGDFMRMTNDGTTQMEFMIKSPKIAQNIEFLLGKKFEQEINVYPYDFPRELAQLRKEISEITILENLDKLKTEIIKNLYQRTKDQEKDIVSELDTAANGELAQWADLADKYSSELSKFQMICYYCGCTMNSESVNENCSVNTVKLPSSKFKGFTEEKSKEIFNGNSSHFFAKPKMEVFDSPEAFQNLQAIFQKESDKNPYKQTLKIQIEKVVGKIRRAIFEKNMDLLPIFQQHDEMEMGIINSIKFTYILNEFFGVKESEILQIAKVFDPSHKNLINYMEFSRLVHDPSCLDEMPLFNITNATAEELENQNTRLGVYEDDYEEPSQRLPGEIMNRNMAFGMNNLIPSDSALKLGQDFNNLGSRRGSGLDQKPIQQINSGTDRLYRQPSIEVNSVYNSRKDTRNLPPNSGIRSNFGGYQLL